MTRRATTSIAASPVLVGAITLLVAFVAVFLAYNANAGLPFVPTYDLGAELPSGSKLVKGNEVRVGGFRVGVVERIDPAYRRVGEERRAIAVVALKLDKSVEPLADDSRLRVRPRSALGLKYLELTPGDSARNLTAGDRLPLSQGSETGELETVLSTFTERTRVGVRESTASLGEALVGRGPALNDALVALRPLLARQIRVARLLSDPDTRLAELLPALERTLAEVAPVAGTAAELFSDSADALAALGRDPAALAGTIERLPPTLAVATGSLRRSRPVLAALAGVVSDLQPVVDELPATLPPLRSALRTGTPVLGRSLELSSGLESAAGELRDLMRNPSTLLSLRDLRTTLAVTRPLIEFVAPYQTVCNLSMYFLNGLGEHQSSPGPGGTTEPQLAKVIGQAQPNTLATTFSSRPWDLPPGMGAQDARFGEDPAGRILVTPNFPAIDAQGNADCQNGQLGYPDGRLLDPTHRKNGQSSDPSDPSDIVFGTLPDGTPAGLNAAVLIPSYPGLSGGTYVSRRLGIDNLRDVP